MENRRRAWRVARTEEIKVYSQNVKIQNHFGDRDGDGRIGSSRNFD
jgi:hypothetical protein